MQIDYLFNAYGACSWSCLADKINFALAPALSFRSKIARPAGTAPNLALLILLSIFIMLAIFYFAAPQYFFRANDQIINSSERKVVTWDYAVDSSNHGFAGTLNLTKMYGRNNLTPAFDARNGSSDWLYPTLLQDSLCMYKITRNETYIAYARSAAKSLEENMLNDKGIIRMYSFRNGASNTEPTDLNCYLLPAVAELAIYDPGYKPLAKKIAYGIVNYGLSDKEIPYGEIYPNGTAADTINGLPSNGGTHGTISLAVMGLLRAYQATGDQIFLNKSRSILMSVWNNKRTKANLIPTIFDSVSLKTVNSSTQLYATGELLNAYIYYYYLTLDPQIKGIISDYSFAAYNRYWNNKLDGNGYFIYRVNADTGRPSQTLMETNWHKLDMSLVYASEITGRNYLPRIYRDMDTFWLGKGLAYKNSLFRHGTKFDGRPANNTQSLIFASFRTADYIMLRMLNQGAFNSSDAVWNDKVWKHVDAVRSHHYNEYGYHTDISVNTFKPDARYFGLSVISACDEFSSLATLIFNTTPNVKMAWEIFPKGNFILEPFSVKYNDDVSFMDDVFMDYSHREIAFRKIASVGNGRIYCSQKLSKVFVDGQAYEDWDKNMINTIDGSHEYILIFEGGSYILPKYLLTESIDPAAL